MNHIVALSGVTSYGVLCTVSAQGASIWRSAFKVSSAGGGRLLLAGI
jgi:hypothetical protein